MKFKKGETVWMDLTVKCQYGGDDDVVHSGSPFQRVEIYSKPVVVITQGNGQT